MAERKTTKAKTRRKARSISAKSLDGARARAVRGGASSGKVFVGYKFGTVFTTKINTTDPSDSKED